MQRTWVRTVAGSIGVAVLASCGSSAPAYVGPTGGPPGCTSSPTKVCIVGTAFSPATLTVLAGTTVSWQNGSSATHTVTSAMGSTLAYDSNDISSGGIYSQTFN